MNFEKEDLLSMDEIKALIENPDVCDKADIFKSKLNKYLVITTNKLYQLDLDTVTYTKISKDIETSIFQKVTKLISVSYKNLTDDQRDLIELKYAKSYKKIYDKAVIYKYIDLIVERITDDSIVFDHYYNELHFANGYVNLKTGKFYKRVFGKHYITAYVDRKYKKSSEKSRNELDDILKKIYVDKNDREVLLYKLLQAFTGLTSNEKEVLFLLGLANTSTSTIMNLLKLALPCYVFELVSDTFTMNNPKRDKIISSFIEQKQTLIAWTNELKAKRMDAELFKEFCEGIIKVTLLYKDGLYQVNLKFKAVFTSNEMPSLEMDDGTITRCNGYEHKSKFTKNKNEVNNINVFLADEKLILNKANDDDFKNAIVDLVVKYCIDYNNKDKPENKNKYALTENFINTKASIVLSNDRTQDFIDEKLEITNDEMDRIGKEDMLQVFQAKYKNSHISLNQLLSALKGKSLIYEASNTVHGVKGVWVGVKFKNPNDAFMFNKEANNENEEEDDFTIDGLKKMVSRLTKSNSQLTKQVEDLTAKLLQYEKPQEKIEEKIVENQEENEKLEKEDIQNFFSKLI